jgi:hypothetical protein
VVVRRLLNVASAVLMVRMRVPPSQRPPHRNNAYPTQMNSPSLAAHPLPLKSTAMSPTRDQQLHKCYKHLPFARTYQSWMPLLWLLRDRNSSGPSLIRYDFSSVGAPRDISITNIVFDSQSVKATPQDTTTLPPAPVSSLPHKLPVSFAAVANGAPDTSKEVSVSA